MTDSSARSTVATERLASLDAFRGATILAMILVNNPGSWGSLYRPLAHAEWHGWTPTDLIFPFFLFIVGAALAYSLRKYEGPDKGVGRGELLAKIARRTAILILLGLGLGLFGQACDVAFGTAEGFDLGGLRWPGVLQRIGLVYAATALLVLYVRPSGRVAIGAALLLGYWGLLAWLPRDVEPARRFENDSNVVREVDLALIGKSHMYTHAASEPTEPEGLLSTLPAIVTALLGFAAGRFVQTHGANWGTVAALAAAGAALIALGLAWHGAFPINKKLWTSSFVVLTGGWGMVGLAASLAMFDVAGFKRAAAPLAAVGVNAITAFVGSGMLARLIGTILVGEGSLQQWIYQRGFADHFADPRLASLGFALATVAFWWGLMLLFWRKGWTLKV